jgi:hypothetical protein
VLSYILELELQGHFNSWLKDRSYNFLSLNTGYTIKKNRQYHDFRIILTKKGAISLLDKQDFYFDPIILDLQAFRVIGTGPSKQIELGIYNSNIGIRYGYGKNIKNWLSILGYLQTDISLKKRFTINWYADYENKHSSNYSENTYSEIAFRKDSPLFNKVSNINLELGINGLIHIGTYFAINLDVAQSIIPSVHKGPHPEYSEYVYFEKNEYFTSVQVGLLTYFGK